MVIRTVKIILKSGVETFSQNSHIQQTYINKFDYYLYCFHDKIRIYFMSFIVQILPFVHLFTLKIIFRWSPSEPSPGLCPGPAGGLARPPDPSQQVVPTFYFIPSYDPGLKGYLVVLLRTLNGIVGCITKYAWRDVWLYY